MFKAAATSAAQTTTVFTQQVQATLLATNHILNHIHSRHTAPRAVITLARDLLTHLVIKAFRQARRMSIARIAKDKESTARL